MKSTQKKAVKEKPLGFFELLAIWFRTGLLWYAVISLLWMVAGSLTGVGDKYLNVKAFLMLFPFGLCMSAAGMLFASAKIQRWLRILGHYVITIVAFILFVLLPNQNAAAPFKGSFILILIVLLTVIYWILFLFVHIFKTKIKKLFEE
ncbi:MAG: hypothetical protein IJW29_02565 [Clostridia bacterium]|nr:hypothetical protein [Clostridia bacterium]